MIGTDLIAAITAAGNVGMKIVGIPIATRPKPKPTPVAPF